MNETTNKRKERIKTILIIFLVILLVLTFFSNTIQNYSLPIVAAQYASYGTVTETVRCSGIVSANQNYDVVAEGTRTVDKVEVKAGDEVREGDVLFVLEGAEGNEAYEAAKTALEEAELSYQKALLTAAPDYAAENQAIANAREDLQDSINDLNAARNSGGISDYEYELAMSRVTEHTNRLTALTADQAALESGRCSMLSADYAQPLTELQAKLDAASADAAAVQASYDALAAGLTVDSSAQAQTIAALERTASEAELAYIRAKEDYEASGEDITLKRAMEDAQLVLTYAQEDVENAKTELTAIQQKELELAQAGVELEGKLTAQSAAQNALDSALASIRSQIEAAIAEQNAAIEEANRTITAYQGQTSADISALEAQVKQQERTLQDLLIALAETKKNDTLTQEMNSLDLQSQQNAIDKMKEELEELKKNSGTLEVTSKHDGIVSMVNFAAGDSVMDGDTLASLTLTDSGFTVQCTVTANQAKKVKVGTEADVTNGYGWGIDATLVNIKTDTQNATGSDKILTFDVEGDVTAGQSLSFSISCSSANYDCVVPTSAVMEDKDGKFVMVVTAKSTPLGNRYYANRVSVDVLASDEINSAVSGDIMSSDFVITTSEKPLENGMQIRMED